MSGITDEAAIEGHDLIQRAEEEEESTSLQHVKAYRNQLHTHDNAAANKQKATGGLGDAPAGDKKSEQPSTLDKVKEALHMKK
ncbi:hypothetical protein CP532_6254 [Ophiocordyceps camponoti-leonardi (nom. inval.)]|nr:hypothetical protein CP532_6254 [Ophiocordyceps camponoti-leonardi (nom. inval.)]